MMTMTLNELRLHIDNAARRHALDPAIVYGVCKQESGLEPGACRYEPDYRWIKDADNCRPRLSSLSTEIEAQKTSWGLMQVMGGVLRERGLVGWIWWEMRDIDAQLDYGCRHLAAKIKKYGPVQGIAAYNTGKPLLNGGRLVNQAYVDRVLKYSREY